MGRLTLSRADLSERGDQLPTRDKAPHKLQKTKAPGEVRRVCEGVPRDFEKKAGAEPGSAGRPGKALPDNIAVHDSTHMPKQRAANGGGGCDASYSGSQKAHTNNAVLTVRRDGLMLEMGGYAR